MLSIRKLQQSNRVLRGSGKELLALASPSLSPEKAGRFAIAAAAAAAVVVVVAAAAAGDGSGGVTGGVTSAGGACGGARLRHASSCAQAALPALTQIAESASATVAALRSTDGSMLVPIISTIRSISPGGPPEVSRPIKQKPLT